VVVRWKRRAKKSCKNHEQIDEKKQVMPKMTRAIVIWFFSSS
jgi:hypothetical protein